MSDVTLKQMMEAGLHFGHQTRRWNPKMRQYIFGARNGIYIVNLQKTLKLFEKALEFMRGLAADGGSILFVGTKPQAKEIISREAARCGMPYVRERWLGGMLTNFDTIKMSIGRLKHFEEMEEDGSFKILAKKEVIRLQKEKAKLDRYLGGIREMPETPDAVFIVDTRKERIALAEALKLSIPVVAIVDTNCNPDGIEYVIPGNDDATRAIELVTTALADAVLEGAGEFDMKQKALAEDQERAIAQSKKAEEKESQGAEPVETSEEAGAGAAEAGVAEGAGTAAKEEGGGEKAEA